MIHRFLSLRMKIFCLTFAIVLLTAFITNWRNLESFGKTLERFTKTSALELTEKSGMALELRLKRLENFAKIVIDQDLDGDTQKLQDALKMQLTKEGSILEVMIFTERRGTIQLGLRAAAQDVQLLEKDEYAAVQVLIQELIQNGSSQAFTSIKGFATKPGYLLLLRSTQKSADQRRFVVFLLPVSTLKDALLVPAEGDVILFEVGTTIDLFGQKLDEETEKLLGRGEVKKLLDYDIGAGLLGRHRDALGSEWYGSYIRLSSFGLVLFFKHSTELVNAPIREAIQDGVLWITLVTLFVLLGAYFISDWLIDRLGRLNFAVERMAKGDFAASLPVRGHDELARLSQSVNHMGQELSRLLEKERNYNQDLERKVAERTRDIQAVLRNIRQGIVILTGDDLRASEHFSPFLGELLESQSIKGRTLENLILDHCDIPAAQKRVLYESGVAVMGQDQIAFELNSGNLPRDFSIHLPNRMVTVEAQWDPVIDDSGRIEAILLSLRDVTLDRKMKAMEAKADFEALIGHLLIKCGRRSYESFLSKYREHLEFIHSHLANDSYELNVEFIQSTLSVLHSLKGSSRTLGFLSIAAAVHDLEHICQDLRARAVEIVWGGSAQDNSFTSPSGVRELVDLVDKLKVGIYSIKDSLKQIELIALTKLGWDVNRSSLEVEERLVLDLLAEARDVPLHRFPSFRETLHSLMAQAFISVEHVIREAGGNLSFLAKQLGKDTPDVRFYGPEAFVHKSNLATLHMILPHLFANSMDHGLEDRTIRIAKNKSPMGCIQISLHAEKDSFILCFEDDGAGLNLSQIRSSAVKKKIISETAELSLKETAELIFAKGFSTKGSVTDISGRGVGISAVKEILEKVGGSIRILLHQPSQTDESAFNFAFEMRLPADFFMIWQEKIDCVA